MSAPPGTAPPPAYGPPPPMYAPPPKPRTIMPLLGGILLLVAAIDGLATWAYVAFIGALASSVGIPFVGGILTTCGAIGIIFAIIALLGGIMAMMRKMWALALIGSILGLFLGGWLVFVALIPEASLLSLIALILIAISRKEF